MSIKAPEIIKIRAKRGNPSAFHRSFFIISLGPIVSFLEIALVAAANMAAFAVQRLIPPLPRKSSAPNRRNNMPSMNKGSVGEKLLFEKSLKLIRYMAMVIIVGMPKNMIKFVKIFLVCILITLILNGLNKR